MNRREFVKGALLSGAAAWSWPLTRHLDRRLPAVASEDASMLEQAPADSPIDTVVIVVMENRSFDHYLGWLASDPGYLEAGRRAYGKSFHVDGRTNLVYRDASGRSVHTQAAGAIGGEGVETRGCTFRSPGHGWNVSRLQRDHGFLAAGTGNDEFALFHYRGEDLPLYAAMARRFTVFDRWHASLLGPTFPNRQYLLSGQSEGRKLDPSPLVDGIFRAETIVDRLARAGVSVGYYHTHAPLLALWGADRMAPYIHSLDDYFADAAAGRLPHVVILEPSFGGGDRTDDHPRGDIRFGQRWVRSVFRAFVEAPQWSRGAFLVTYDEGGGFFDHVRPPILADQRSSSVDADNFGQAGFRVPTFLASPWSRPGAVDHGLYDHTSILRFLEWRFLGAPAHGPGGRGRWWLTTRDRMARNLGVALRSHGSDPDPGFDLGLPIPPPNPECRPSQRASLPADATPDPFERSDRLDELVAERFPGASYKPWLTA